MRSIDEVTDVLKDAARRDPALYVGLAALAGFAAARFAKAEPSEDGALFERGGAATRGPELRPTPPSPPGPLKTPDDRGDGNGLARAGGRPVRPGGAG